VVRCCVGSRGGFLEGGEDFRTGLLDDFIVIVSGVAEHSPQGPAFRHFGDGFGPVAVAIPLPSGSVEGVDGMFESLDFDSKPSDVRMDVVQIIGPAGAVLCLRHEPDQPGGKGFWELGDGVRDCFSFSLAGPFDLQGGFGVLIGVQFVLSEGETDRTSVQQVLDFGFEHGGGPLQSRLTVMGVFLTVWRSNLTVRSKSSVLDSK